MIAFLLTALLLAGPPDKHLPEHYDTYGREVSSVLYSTCVDASRGFDLDRKSVEEYCVCHVYILESVVPFPDFKKMSKPDKTTLFEEITQGCKELGFSPRPKQKKSPIKPIPSPKVPSGEVISI
jgi:hypothetical protein